MAIRAAALSAAPPTPDDWPCWRGPTHDGQASAGQVVPHSWGDAEHVIWTVDVPGRGNGSPTVVGSRVYLATCDEATGSQSVLAYDRATGKQLWQRQVHAAGAMRKNEKSTGASTTVSADGGRLFITFPNSDAVFCTALDPDGQVLWQTRVCDYAIHQGYGASPLVHDGRVFVIADHKNRGRVAALDPATGKVLWEKERPPAPNYSSPIVWKLFGRDQLILTGADLSYWERKMDAAYTFAERAPSEDARDYILSEWEPWEAALDGLRRALDELGLLDAARELDLRTPVQDYFSPLFSNAWNMSDLNGAGTPESLPADGDDTETS
jgi:hypothetical protein